MKLELVNDNQIRCTLSQEDLDERKLKLSELTYGSEKANRLFRDVMQQANYQFGFEINDNPLMIEAVPMQSGKIVFVITKVEQPDEFESHISEFTAQYRDLTEDLAEDPLEPMESATGQGTGSDTATLTIADDADAVAAEETDQAEKAAAESMQSMDSAAELSDESDASDEDDAPMVDIPEGLPTGVPIEVTSATISIPLDAGGVLPTLGQALHSLFHEMISRQVQHGTQEEADNPRSGDSRQRRAKNRIFIFTSIHDVIDAAAVLRGQEMGENVLYKDPTDGRFYVLLYAKDFAPESYRRVCTILHDFSVHCYDAELLDSHMDEYFELVLSSHALQSLGSVTE